MPLVRESLQENNTIENMERIFKAAKAHAFQSTGQACGSGLIKRDPMMIGGGSRLLVLGAGYIGLEFAQMMHRFGSKVTVFERGGQILSREDAAIAEALANCLRREGVEIQLNAEVEQVRKFSDGQVGIIFRTPKGKQEWTGSHLLVALGRAPVTKDLDLPAAG